MYLDDGITPNAFESGNYAILHFSSQSDDRQIILSIKPEKGVTFQPRKKSVDIAVHNLSGKPKSVAINGKSVKYKYDKNSRMLTFPASYDLESSRNILIKL